jgi:hypothetical protein
MLCETFDLSCDSAFLSMLCETFDLSCDSAFLSMLCETFDENMMSNRGKGNKDELENKDTHKMSIDTESHDKLKISPIMDKKAESHDKVVNFNGLLVTDLNFFFITNLSPTVFALSISVLI